MRDVYLTGLGRFLPGEPVDNDAMESVLGEVAGAPSRARARVLKQNGIRLRHYALDRAQRSVYRNSEMAANAVRDAVEHAGLRLEDVSFLATATTQADLLVPGFASMVHGELGTRSMELASLHGVCASGMMALKTAYLQVGAGEHDVAAACASEFPSRVFKGGRYAEQDFVQAEGTLPLDTEFLRWMLSDGAGAAVLSHRPNPRGLSLKVEWLDLVSHADQNDVCMYAGANKDREGKLGASWLDYPSFEAAARDGAINLKQDMRLLDRIFQLGVRGLFERIEAGRVDPARIDWLACHYSSHVFKGKIVDLLAAGGLTIPEERWFTNLYEKGNLGSASMFVMLEEMMNEGHLRPGQQVLCVVPESGRFVMAYMLLTVVGEVATPRALAPVSFRPGAPVLRVGPGAVQQSLVRQLTKVWVDFEQDLAGVPVLARLAAGTFTLDDYKALLVNVRQQVIEGARWISRAASNLTIEAAEIRSAFIQHAREEHRDYEMLERDYVSVGGELAVIRAQPKNVGSEALSAWMFQCASRENPYELIGAMFIIEGLGNRLAARWAERIQEVLEVTPQQVTFLGYHGVNDESHFGRLEKAIDSGLLTEAMVERIVKTARVTARLYRLQLEELGNC